LAQYSDALGIPRLPDVVARYAYATERRITRWFVGDATTTERVPKTTRRINISQPYLHQRWIAHGMKLPLRCSLSQRRPVLIEPWIVWMYEAMTTTLMGFCLCACQPTMQDYLRTLRWSIWHFDAPWWKARGIPDRLVLPSAVDSLPDDTRRALHYLQTEVEYAETAYTTGEFVGFPDDFADWMTTLGHQMTMHTPEDFTLSALREHIVEHIKGWVADAHFATSTPSALSEQQVSLPWSTGVSAALLLPSFGEHTVIDGKVTPYEVPYDARSGGVHDGTVVDCRYDPDDARTIYLVADRAHVTRVYACAFEHRTSWFELIAGSLVETDAHESKRDSISGCEVGHGRTKR
jgi:hypothetical protein